jgi:hypothetical protein
MSTANDQDMIDRFTPTCQIIVGALIAGVLFFLGIAASIDMGIRHPIQPGAGAGSFLDAFVSGPFITYTAIAFAAVLLPLSLVVPGIIAAQNRRAIATGKWAVPPLRGIEPEALATDTGRLVMVYQQQLIIGAAMNEGLAFFAACAYLIEKSPIALGLAILLVVGLILRFPTRRRVELWIDQQREKLILERQVGG